jgi:RecA/RadA recombinase
MKGSVESETRLLKFQGNTYFAKRGETKKCSTLSDSIDDLLGGGISPGSATEVYGGSGTGKSQFCFQLSVGFSSRGRRVLYFDASGAFRPERIEEIAIERNITPRLDLIHVSRLKTSQGLSQLLEIVKKGPLGLDAYEVVIIDSIADFFLGSQGEDDYSFRMILPITLQQLSVFSLRTLTPVIFTNQVRTRITQSESSVVEFGGNVIAQMVHNRILFEKIGQNFFASVWQLTGEKNTRQIFISAIGIR